MSTLNILENGLDKPVEDQLKQLNLNMQALLAWSKTVNNSIPLNFKDNTTADIITTSQTYVDIPGYSSGFIPSTGLINYKIKINLSATVTSSVGVYIDNTLVDEYRNALLSPNTMVIDGYQNIQGNVQHVITIKWKLLFPGTLTKIKDGKNSVQVISLIQ